MAYISAVLLLYLLTSNTRFSVRDSRQVNSFSNFLDRLIPSRPYTSFDLTREVYRRLFIFNGTSSSLKPSFSTSVNYVKKAAFFIFTCFSKIPSLSTLTQEFENVNYF